MIEVGTFTVNLWKQNGLFLNELIRILQVH